MGAQAVFMAHAPFLGFLGVFAFLVMLGLFYRAAIWGFVLVFGYFFLLDKAQYLNHNYMVLLYAILLALAPANRAFSLDARWGLVARSEWIARWPVAAVKLQTEIILIYAGIVKITDDWLRGEPLGMWLRARDTLNRICDLAEEEGVTFTLENLNLRDHPGCPFGSTVDVLALVASVDRPQLLINLDLCHTQIGEGDVIRWAEACLPWVGEVQVADKAGRCEPGTGEMNWPNITRALRGMNYDGSVGLEAFAKDDVETALEAFRRALEV